MKFIGSQAAIADLERLRNFLVGKNPSAAGKAIAAIVAAMRSLDTFPERGRLSATPNVRELVVPFGRGGYVLRYRHFALQDEILIIASGTAAKSATSSDAQLNNPP